MGEKFFENGVWREIVSMRVPVTEGNPDGLVKIYRDQVPSGAEIVGDAVIFAPEDDGRKEAGEQPPVDPVVTAPWAKGKAKK
jgi:hypothetical protein